MKFNPKPSFIRRISPIRRIIDKAYKIILASYLGKIIIELNSIDHVAIDFIFYFIVFNPRQDGVKEYYRAVSTKTMGTKVRWFKMIYEGKVEQFKKEINTTLPVCSNVTVLKNNKRFKVFIDKLEVLVSDTRNPLVHSHYLLGYGNEYKLGLSYQRSLYNKSTNEIEFNPFTLSDAKKYLAEVLRVKEQVQLEGFKLIGETYDIT